MLAVNDSNCQPNTTTSFYSFPAVIHLCEVSSKSKCICYDHVLYMTTCSESHGAETALAFKRFCTHWSYSVSLLFHVFLIHFVSFVEPGSGNSLQSYCPSRYLSGWMPSVYPGRLRMRYTRVNTLWLSHCRQEDYAWEMYFVTLCKRTSTHKSSSELTGITSQFVLNKNALFSPNFCPTPSNPLKTFSLSPFPLPNVSTIWRHCLKMINFSNFLNLTVI